MERITDLLVEATLHGVITALAVELLIRRLTVQDLASRARLRLAALAVPLATVPLLNLAAPWRDLPAFADISLFWSARWNAVSLLGLPVRDTTFTLVAALGTVILLRDAFADAAHALHRRGGSAGTRPLRPGSTRLARSSAN